MYNVFCIYKRMRIDQTGKRRKLIYVLYIKYEEFFKINISYICNDIQNQFLVNESQSMLENLGKFDIDI